MTSNSCLKDQQTLPKKGRVSRVIQIHASLKCNLTCSHCYSTSSPQHKGGLEITKLKHVIEQLSTEGYNVISLSGGEPFLYDSIAELLEYSKSLRYFNSVTTNAMLLKSNRARQIMKNIDLMAISLDGKPDQHDAIRSHQGAFNKMIEGVQIVRDNVPNFGFIHTLFPNGWQIMPWLTEFALEQKAKLMQFHPLEMAGRGANYQSKICFDSINAHKIYIIFYYLKQYYANDILMQLDLLHRDNLRDNTDFFFPEKDIDCLDNRKMSSLFKELIIDEAGDIIPISHGCSKYFKIGNINDDKPVVEMIENFLQYKMTKLMELYNSTYQEILADENLELFNWSEIIIRKSQHYGIHTDRMASHGSSAKKEKIEESYLNVDMYL